MPGIGTLLNLPEYAPLIEEYGRRLVTDAIRERLAAERAGTAGTDSERLTAIAERLRAITRPRLRRVINGTGVVLHTNLGRAPLSASATEAVGEIARGYSNLEYDLERGRRGERATGIRELITRLTGTESALVVNNNAGAVLLALTGLCRGREVVISRGQLIEIGGAFRMPDVMRLSGARMVEVGTTNRTRAADYADAIGPRTAAIFRAHPSNYRITGFAEEVPISELAAIAHAHGVLLIDDIGSGALQPYWDEPQVVESAAVSDLVLFSGDKLFGGPQAGIAAGRAELVAKLARHPLARALRIDKLALAALEASLIERLTGRANPVQRMLAADPEALRRRAAMWVESLMARSVPARLIQAASMAGGGSLPEQALPSWLLAVEGPASRLVAELRAGDPPVIARVEAGRCAIDARTVLPDEDEALLVQVEAAYKRAHAAGSGSRDR